MAVPPGTYRLVTSIDLGPLGRHRRERTVTVPRIPPDLLDVRLRELESGDAETRFAAICDLAYFPDAGARIVPAALARLDDPDARVRGEAFYRVAGFAGPDPEIERRLEAAVDAADEKWGSSLRWSLGWYRSRWGLDRR